MSEITILGDHMARACDCGAVRFNLLKSGGIECDECHQKQNLSWSENSMTLQDLLSMTVESKNISRGIIQVPPEFRVTVQEKTEQGVRIIIHADGHNSETMDFWVKGDELSPVV